MRKPTKCFRTQLLKDAEIHSAAQFFQGLGTGKAVALLVQTGREDADAHTGGNDRHNAAADAALGRYADADGKVARTIIHTAGDQNGIDIVGVFGREYALIGDGQFAAVGKDIGDAGQVLTGDLDGAGLEIAVEDLFDIVMDDTVGLEQVSQRTVLVAGAFSDR